MHGDGAIDDEKRGTELRRVKNSHSVIGEIERLILDENFRCDAIRNRVIFGSNLDFRDPMAIITCPACVPSWEPEKWTSNL